MKPVAAAVVFAYLAVALAVGVLAGRKGDGGTNDFVAGERAFGPVVMYFVIGATIFFLMTMESRVKRGRALKAIHELRSIAHIIDMHQLTKDPVVFNPEVKPTASSPKRVLSKGDLSRYLDYCSEMLAVTGKLAALYAQAVPDTEVAEAVNDVEMLGSNLSRKIWQKIMLIGPSMATKPARRPRK